MITHMNRPRRRTERPVPPLGFTPKNLGGIVVSVAAAVVLLPAIGLKAAAGAVRTAKGNAPENHELRPPFYGWND